MTSPLANFNLNPHQLQIPNFRLHDSPTIPPLKPLHDTAKPPSQCIPETKELSLEQIDILWRNASPLKSEAFRKEILARDLQDVPVDGGDGDGTVRKAQGEEKETVQHA